MPTHDDIKYTKGLGKKYTKRKKLAKRCKANKVVYTCPM